MRHGFTTGSCSAAAAKAACYMLLTGKEKNEITIETPKGILFHANIVEIERHEKSVSCGVIKDGGDDPDITTGALIKATVAINEKGKKGTVQIDGGCGVGRVTKPGLDQPVGEAAINHVPRQMIQKEVLEVVNLCDFEGALLVEISVQGGEELAQKTFNPRLGIVGGISILGTSGIVEPMSSQALLDTIRVEIGQKKALNYEVLAVSPGNYGLDFMKETFDYDLDKSVKCSNFIGDTIDMAREVGFSKMLLTGHIGKLIKVSGGMMNTHSKEGDCRMELLTSFAIKAGCEINEAKEILECVTTEEGVRILKDVGILDKTMLLAMERILFFLNKRAGEHLQIECMMYSNEFGMLAMSNNAEEYLKQLMME